VYVFLIRQYLKNSLNEESGSQRHKKMQLKALSVMMFFVFTMNLAFLTRMVIVYLQQFHPTINFGQAVYLGYGVILCEGYGCLIIVSVALLSFYQSKKEFKKRLSQRLLEEDESSIEASEQKVPSRYSDF
jgi:hypothetical protein